MANQAFYKKNSNGTFDLYVTGAVSETHKNAIVYTHDNEDRIKTISNRLTKLFKDGMRDLDFIAPSYVNGSYVIACPLVRKSIAGIYTHTLERVANQQFYNDYIWNPNEVTFSTTQCSIMTISKSEFDKPWVKALEIANKIRNNIEENDPSYFLLGGAPSIYDGKIMKIPEPKNVGTTVSKDVLVDNYDPHISCLPDQGSRNETIKSKFPYWNGRDAIVMKDLQMANNEVMHCNDLVIAVNKKIYDLHKNKFVKVTNKSNNLSVIARIADITPNSRQFELYMGVWRALGYPGGTDPNNDYKPIPNNCKIELMLDK